MADKYAQLVELLETHGVLQFDGEWAEPIIAFVEKNRPRKRNTRAQAPSQVVGVVVSRELLDQCLSSMQEAVRFRETGIGRPPEQTCLFAIEDLSTLLDANP